MGRPASSKQIVFRERLRVFVGTEPVGVVAKRLGIEYRRFHRWLSLGVERSHRKSFEDLKKLAGAMGLEDWHDLWKDISAEEEAAAKQHQTIRHKMDVLLNDDVFGKQVVEAIDSLWHRRAQSHSDASTPEAGIEAIGSDGQNRPLDKLKRIARRFW